MAADGEGDVASGTLQLVGDLDAGRRCTDHEHATIGHRRWVAIRARDDLGDVGGEPLAIEGTAGWSHQPVAITTLAARCVSLR